ncbi:Deoxycytidylate deaminase [Thermomonospora echinospora]|uniref:Deoxycytidylate deaminase n=1 Tax=Thermomonospora echinospora TaxID=1992 RepID=A0A1H6DWR5_9ACTN|nr:deaminase [Thermomonospora echinospora]SEG89639.1 Deoxycytidylate deaminase [Thermomonospora echinospora]
MKQVLLYLPVLHAGYEAFLDRHADADEVLLLGAGFREVFPALRKDIRALSPERAAACLRPGRRVRVVEPADLPDALTASVLVMPDEEIMRSIAHAHGLDPVFERTFLRWDRPWSKAAWPVGQSVTISAEELARTYLRVAQEEAGHSSDWWRQVGAVAVRDGEILGTAHNHHHPTEYAPYFDGDPRNEYSRGVHADLSTAIHAEAALVATAAREGVRLAGADLFVTTFPCPACARLVAETGFRRCFFTGVYSVLDGEAILRAAGVELFWVDLSEGEGPDLPERAELDPSR